MHNPIISVIIPIYNIEKYIGRCLTSIIDNSYRNLQIICVNDGSKDNSLSILKEYTQKDSRIKVINQENSGVIAARNNAAAINFFIMVNLILSSFLA